MMNVAIAWRLGGTLAGVETERWSVDIAKSDCITMSKFFFSYMLVEASRIRILASA